MTRLAGAAQSTREQLLSTDLNTIQRFVSRDVLNVLLGLLGVNGVGVVSDEIRLGVIDGLRVTIGTANPPTVIVSAGRCLGFDVSGTPEATTQDSLYRLGEQTNGSTQTLSLAALPVGVDRIDLIEAVPVYDTITTESRNIYDNATGLFAPALVPKQQRPGIDYVVTSATAAIGTVPFIPAFTPGRVPIAAVLVTAAGGAARVYDLRKFLATTTDLHGLVAGGTFWTGIKGIATTSIVIGPFEAYVNGVRVRQEGQRTYTTLSRMDAGAGFINNRFVFVYCAIPAGASLYDPVADAIGEIIISTQAPSETGRPSADFSGGVRPLSAALAGRAALYMGAVFLQTAGTGAMRPCMHADDGWTHQRIDAATTQIAIAGPLSVAAAGQTVELSAASIPGVELVPQTATAVRIAYHLLAGAAPTGDLNARFNPGAADPGVGLFFDRVVLEVAAGAAGSRDVVCPIHSRQINIGRQNSGALDAAANEIWDVVGYHDPARRVL